MAEKNHEEEGSDQMLESVTYPLLEVIKGNKPSRIPIWIMRQAGRYLPEFQEIRKEHGFFDIVNNPELAAKVTMLPIERYDLDAAIIFSDILVVPQAVGMCVEMCPGVGPVLKEPIQKPENILRLNFDVDVTMKMSGTLGAITKTRELLKNRPVALFGFSGAPWTLMSYMIEGGGTKTAQKAKQWLYSFPKESVDFLNKLTKVVVNYLVEQAISGAQVLQVFESQAEHLTPNLFQEFVEPTLKQIAHDFKAILKQRGYFPPPLVIFAKGGHFALESLSKIGYDVVSIDYTIDAKKARKEVGPDVVIQGNLDPCALFAPKNTVTFLASKIIKEIGGNHIFNLGHGIYPETPTEAVQWLIDQVHNQPITK